MSSGSSRPQSVRGLYTPPAEEWVFLPPTVSPPAAAAAQAQPAHLPTPFAPEDDDLTDLGLPGPVQLFGSQFFLTALGMPFDVGKTLLQVEYRPRKKYAPPEVRDEQSREASRDWGAEEDTLSNPDEADVYFSDRLVAPSGNFVPPPPPKSADASGYLEDTSPTWLLKDDPDVSRGNGVWGMIRRVRATASEGLPALWKGQVVATLQGVLSTVLQPRIHALVFSAVPSSGAPLPLDFPLTALPHPGLPLVLQVASHALTQFILSPLELVKTRLIVAPGSLPSTPSSVTILRRAIRDEGGFTGLYLAPNVLIPTLLEVTLKPLLSMAIPLVLERQLGISPDISPLTYSLADLTLNIASLLVVLPIETVRKRLQLQSRAPGGRKVRSVVRLRERDYVGVVEAIWRIITEETAAPRKRRMTEKDEGGAFAGVCQLYRGFGMAVSSHVTVFALQLVTAGLRGGVSHDSGWKEI
ncbi:hypothetical protein Q8F55_007789 [Vanrija albida]|uniref:Mitochondrial carrier n=1 Tax=Vanrija albida TaxID=181172 RepID=A0ABR3PUJ1_9TREE